MALRINSVQDGIRAGLERAETMGIQISIAVVDPAGYLVAAARMDDALLLSPEIALGKAAAAALFRQSGADLSKRWQPGAPVPAAIFARTGGRFVPHQGGLPILQSGAVVGAVGVSGASSAQDEEVAQAVIDAMRVRA